MVLCTAGILALLCSELTDPKFQQLGTRMSKVWKLGARVVLALAMGIVKSKGERMRRDP